MAPSVSANRIKVISRTLPVQQQAPSASIHPDTFRIKDVTFFSLSLSFAVSSSFSLNQHCVLTLPQSLYQFTLPDSKSRVCFNIRVVLVFKITALSHIKCINTEQIL